MHLSCEIVNIPNFQRNNLLKRTVRLHVHVNNRIARCTVFDSPHGCWLFLNVFCSADWELSHGYTNFATPANGAENVIVISFRLLCTTDDG